MAVSYLQNPLKTYDITQRESPKICASERQTPPQKHRERAQLPTKAKS